MANALSFLSQAYKAHLLLEDPRTYDYFSALFNADTSTVQMINVGGSVGVAGLVTASWEKGSQSSVHALGWKDRDFGRDNVLKWKNKGTHVFYGKMHEIENYMLDWKALAGCDLAIRYKKQAIDYRQEALKIAKGILYDTVCCDVLYSLHFEYTQGFPPTPRKAKPKVVIGSRKDVEDYLLSNAWISNRPGSVIKIFSNKALKKRIVEAEKRYQDALNSSKGNWRAIFPGKEIFEELIRSVYRGKKVDGGSVSVSDMVKSIAEYQRRNGIPKELSKFMGEVRRRRDNGLL